MAEGKPCPNKANVLAAATSFEASADKDIIAEKLVENNEIAETCEALLDILYTK